MIWYTDRHSFIMLLTYPLWTILVPASFLVLASSCIIAVLYNNIYSDFIVIYLFRKWSFKAPMDKGWIYFLLIGYVCVYAYLLNKTSKTANLPVFSNHKDVFYWFRSEKNTPFTLLTLYITILVFCVSNYLYPTSLKKHPWFLFIKSKWCALI